MTEIVTFPDVEALLVQYLAPYFPGVQIGTRVPDDRPDKFLRIQRTGGVKETLVSEAAQFVLEAWALNEVDAIGLLNKARAYVNAADGQLFGPREIGAPVNLPDPYSAQIRYTMTFQIRVRGAVSPA